MKQGTLHHLEFVLGGLKGFLGTVGICCDCEGDVGSSHGPPC